MSETLCVLSCCLPPLLPATIMPLGSQVAYLVLFCLGFGQILGIVPPAWSRASESDCVSLTPVKDAQPTSLHPSAPGFLQLQLHWPWSWATFTPSVECSYRCWVRVLITQVPAIKRTPVEISFYHIKWSKSFSSFACHSLLNSFCKCA